MVECDKAALQFLVPHQQFAESVEPTVANLNDPASGLLGRVTPLGISLGATPDDMGDVIVALNDLQRTLAAISSISTQMFTAPLGRGLAFDHDGTEHLLKLRDIMLVRSCHDER